MIGSSSFQTRLATTSLSWMLQLEWTFQQSLVRDTDQGGPPRGSANFKFQTSFTQSSDPFLDNQHSWPTLSQATLYSSRPGKRMFGHRLSPSNAPEAGQCLERPTAGTSKSSAMTYTTHLRSASNTISWKLISTSHGPSSKARSWSDAQLHSMILQI